MALVTQIRHPLRTLKLVIFRLILLLILLTVSMVSGMVSVQAQMPSAPISVSPTVIVIGFVGGFVHSDDARHPEVQIIERLSRKDSPSFHAAVFENRHRAKALKETMQWLDRDEDGHLSVEERRDAIIIMFGHSWGGSAVIKLARDLKERGIPVSMTIQVDSVNKGWGDDCTIPSNVREAMNFYQTRGMVHGCPSIRAADPRQTRILGNYRFEYTSQPAECRSCSWMNRHFFKSHEAMDCDLRVWSQISKQIQAQIQSALQALATKDQPRTASLNPYKATAAGSLLGSK